MALARFSRIRPHLEEGRPLLAVCRETGLADRTGRRWRRLYLDHGLSGLVRKPRRDGGSVRAMSPDLVKFAEGLALRRPAPSVREITRVVGEAAAQRGVAPPSYRTVARVVGAMSPALVSLAHDGPKAYGHRYDLVHRREADRPNALWQADHTQIDLWAEKDPGKRGRPWLTIIADDYSRAIAGFMFSFEAPSALQTSLALRQAIWRKEEAQWPIFGIPEVLYTDNGSDFTSEHLEQVAVDLKVQLVRSLPGQPRGRGKIERLFATVNQMFLQELPGYLGKGGVRAGKLLTLGDLDRRFRTFLADYHGRSHTETNMAPGVRWTSGGFVPRMADSLEQLDLLLLTVAKSRVVHRDGVRFAGFRYVDPVLAAYVNEPVIIRYDPRDLAEIRLFHQGGFLCRAIAPELAGETVALKDIMAARRSQTASLRRTLQDRARVVDELLALKAGVGELEASVREPSPAPAANLPKLKRYLND